MTRTAFYVRMPNPELVSIDDKLNQLNQSVTANAEIQAATLAKLNEKAERTLEGISGIIQQLTASAQTMPEEMRKIILETLQVWIKLEETKRQMYCVSFPERLGSFGLLSATSFLCFLTHRIRLGEGG